MTRLIMLEINDKLDDRYIILSRVGQGGMSFVYRALDTKLNREVALKVLKEDLYEDEDFAGRFYKEARAAAGLAHPNIVVTYDIADSGDYHYIVMELVEGITLKRYIAKKGVLSNKETIGIAIQAASGIAEAHKNGIVHRDIKPQNIIISRDGKIKVSDFGIALITAENTDESHLVIGSAHYIAPEQVESGVSDARSDIYSLGITMYEMITGKLPYGGESAQDIAVKHVENVIIPPKVFNPDIYPALNDIIMKAANKIPEERYENCDDLINDLKHAVKDPSGHFVKQFDSFEQDRGADDSLTSGSGNAPAASGSEEPVEIRTDAGTGSRDSAGGTAGILSADGTVSGNDETAAIDNADHALRPERTMIFAAIGIFALILIIFSVVMVQRAGRKRAELTGEVNAVSVLEASEDETEMNYTISIAEEDLVPDVIGMSVDLARAHLAELQLSMDSAAQEYSDIYGRGVIIKQNPSGGELFSVGTTVYVTVSKGSVLDDLEDDTPEEAREKLAEAGFEVEDTEAESFSDTVSEGRVVGYMLIGEDGTEAETMSADDDGEYIVTEGEDGETAGVVGRENLTGYPVRLIVSRGSESDYAVMPELRGRPMDDAEREIEALGLLVGTMTAVHSEEYPPGTVAEQSGEPGIYLKLGSQINLTVSVGDDSTIDEGTDMTSISQGEADHVPEPVELSEDYYYGSINTTCVIGSSSGVNGGQNVNVSVRLRQHVDGADEYTHIFGPIPVSVSDVIPVSFRNIRGAFGVDTGYVEVYNPDTGEIYSSFKVEFSSL